MKRFKEKDVVLDLVGATRGTAILATIEQVFKDGSDGDYLIFHWVDGKPQPHDSPAPNGTVYDSEVEAPTAQELAEAVKRSFTREQAAKYFDKYWSDNGS